MRNRQLRHWVHWYTHNRHTVPEDDARAPTDLTSTLTSHFRSLTLDPSLLDQITMLVHVVHLIELTKPLLVRLEGLDLFERSDNCRC